MGIRMEIQNGKKGGIRRKKEEEKTKTNNNVKVK